MNEIYLIGGMALVTFLIRYPLYAVSGRVAFPQTLAQALKYVPPVVLTAIIMPAVLIPGGETIQFSYTNPYLVGAVAAALVGWFSRSLLLTIVLGMAAFWGWQGLLVWLG
jgi:branched-subunit amino acid transport protein